MVSHDLHMVMAESDRVICLNGHVCCEGGPETVRHDPEFVKLFGPQAARMIAAYATITITITKVTMHHAQPHYLHTLPPSRGRWIAP